MSKRSTLVCPSEYDGRGQKITPKNTIQINVTFMPLIGTKIIQENKTKLQLEFERTPLISYKL